MKCWAGRTVEEQKLYNYCNHKKQDGKRLDRPDWNLTNDQVADLLEEAGITIMDVGKENHKYHLARFNDSGPYEIGNCRFITGLENRKEQDHYKQWENAEERRENMRRVGSENWKKFIRENPERHMEISKMGAKATQKKWSNT